MLVLIHIYERLVLILWVNYVHRSLRHPANLGGASETASDCRITLKYILSF